MTRVIFNSKNVYEYMYIIWNFIIFSKTTQIFAECHSWLTKLEVLSATSPVLQINNWF